MEEFLKEIKKIKKEIKSLKVERDEKKELLKSKQDEFKNFLDGHFKKYQIGSCGFNGIIVFDDVNEYAYDLNKNTLSLTKTPKGSFGGFGGHGHGFRDSHPFFMMEEMMFEFMRIQGLNSKETVYEKGEKPKEKEKSDMFVELKKDIEECGEISQTIKNYIGVDKTFRVELEKSINEDNNNISKKQNEINLILRNEFTTNKIENMFSEKSILSTENGYKFIQPSDTQSPIVNVMFDKNLKNSYVFTTNMEDGTSKVLEFRKNYFNITNLIKV